MSRSGFAWYRAAHRGVVFNLLLAVLLAVFGAARADAAAAAYFDGARNTGLAVVIALAFVAEPVFFFKRFRDVCARRRELGLPSLAKSRSGAYLFSLLLFDATIGFFALMVAARALGFPDDEAAGVAGFVITMRFLAMLFSTFHAMDSPRLMSNGAAFRNDVGIALYSTVVYACVWQTAVMRGFGITTAGIHSAWQAAGMLLGLALVVAVWLLPLRAVHFMEEWWARPGRGGVAAIALSLLLLVVEVAYLQLGAALLDRG